jgi:pyruvate,water dikinase
MGEEHGGLLARTLTSGLEGDLTFEQDCMLEAIAEGEAKLEDFLDRFGHRAAGEMELAEPRWREDPTYIEQTIERLRKSPGRSMAEIHEENAQRRREAEEQLPQLLAEWGGSSFREEIERDLRRSQELLPYRETGKYYLMMGYALIRQAIVELGRRFGIGDDVFYLTLDELERFENERDELAKAIARRRIEREAWRRLEMPDVIDAAGLDSLGLPPDIEAADELQGTAVAAGVATGPARIVFDPDDAGDLGTGYVLVCPTTDPGWTPLFLNARGLVVERGGVLSHGAIVARDFGIPAVVCPGATRSISAGATVRVDGNRGKVSIVEQEDSLVSQPGETRD